MTAPSLPKISCLTATNSRLVQLKQSILCYCAQTYPNRELVIATEAGEDYCRAIEKYFIALGRTDYRMVALNGANYTLGAIRNVLLDAADGEIVCQWDDDDLYHPRRLEIQAQRMFECNAQACFLTDQLQFFWRDRELYWVDWTIGNAQGLGRLIPGTLMMYQDKRFRYPEAGPMACRHEDGALLADLAGHLSIAELSDAGYLYVYVYHGLNTFEEDHHRRITERHARELDAMRGLTDTLLNALEHYPLPMPYSIKACLGDELCAYSEGR